MNAPQIHLMLNHLPVIGALFATVTLAVGMLWRNVLLQRFALGTLVVVALSTLPVFLSGEPAEESVEHAVGVHEPSIKPHEEMAKVTLVAVESVGLAALAALILYRRRPVSRGFAMILLLAMFAISGSFAWTAHLGGQIRHPELRGLDAGNTAQRTERRTP